MFRLEAVSLVKSACAKAITILSEINIELQPQSITALIGPSGAGKSSLIRLLNRLDDPTSGTVYFQDNQLASFNVLKLRRQIGMVFQMPVMFPGTVGENIHYATRFQKIEPSQLKTARALLTMVGLDPDLEERRADQLSIGQQQRVSLARTLATNPEVLLLDEPTASLDPTSALEIMQLIRSLQSQLGLTVILITHLLSQAKTYSDFTAYLETGRLIEYGPTELLFTTPQHPEVRNFLAKGEIGA